MLSIQRSQQLQLGTERAAARGYKPPLSAPLSQENRNAVEMQKLTSIYFTSSTFRSLSAIGYTLKHFFLTKLYFGKQISLLEFPLQKGAYSTSIIRRTRFVVRWKWPRKLVLESCPPEGENLERESEGNAGAKATQQPRNRTQRPLSFLRCSFPRWQPSCPSSGHITILSFGGSQCGPWNWQRWSPRCQARSYSIKYLFILIRNFLSLPLLRRFVLWKLKFRGLQFALSGLQNHYHF